MATVTVLAVLPSVRLGLADMLASHGHTVVPEEESSDGTIWVLDAPSAPALDALMAQRYSDSPRAAVILSDEPGMPNQLARAGLRGWACLARDVDGDQLDLAVRSAEAGLVLLDLPIASTSLAVPASLAAPAPLTEPLTARELQVLQLVAQGLPGKQIARALDISERTVKFHVSNLLNKFGVRRRADLILLTFQRRMSQA